MFGLFWWVAFIVPTIRDIAICSKEKTEKVDEDDAFSFGRATGVRRDVPAMPFLRQEPQLSSASDTGAVAILESSQNNAPAIPLHLADSVEEQALPEHEVRRLAQLMLVSIIGYFVAGWFLSRAYIMTLFIYGGMAQVIYGMALQSNMVSGRMRTYKVVQYSAVCSVGLIVLVYLMLRFQHLAGVR
jgi:hypothetical protein